MKGILVKGIGFAVVIALMMQCAPLIGGFAMMMFGKMESLADTVVVGDSWETIDVDATEAEATLDELGERAEETTDQLNRYASLFGADEIDKEFGAGASAQIDGWLEEILDKFAAGAQ